MGCDIHTQAERKVNGNWEEVDVVPFDWRSYSMFAFLVGVRNYSAITPISPPRGLPADAIETEYGAHGGDHSFSWLTLHELLSFNYDQPLEDRRYTRQEGPNFFNGAATAEPGEGTMTTYREFLGEAFFEDLEKLKAADAERIVFGFDS